MMDYGLKGIKKAARKGGLWDSFESYLLPMGTYFCVLFSDET